MLNKVQLQLMLPAVTTGIPLIRISNELLICYCVEISVMYSLLFSFLVYICEFLVSYINFVGSSLQVVTVLKIGP